MPTWKTTSRAMIASCGVRRSLVQVWHHFLAITGPVGRGGHHPPAEPATRPAPTVRPTPRRAADATIAGCGAERAPVHLWDHNWRSGAGAEALVST